MLRWMAVVVLAVIVAACGKSSKKGTGGAPAVLKNCDPAKPLTEAQATAWWKATGEKKVSDITIEDNDLDFSEEGQGIYELGANPCCDIPHLTISYFYACKAYDDEREALRDLLKARGWSTADGPKRVELVKAVDSLLGRSLATPPKTWSPYKTFTPPTIEAQPDGSVKLKRWVRNENCGGQGCDPSFALQVTTVGVDAMTSGEKVEEYSEQPNGYPDPAALKACDPAKPPTKEYAAAVYLQRFGDQKNVDKLVLRDLGHDTWVVELAGSDGVVRPNHHIRHCKVVSYLSDLTNDLLTDGGWAKADAATRQKLAAEIDGMLNTIVKTQPADWDAKHAFTPPKATSSSDGSVTVDRWIQKRPDDGYIDGDDWTYSHEERTYDPDHQHPGRTFEHYLVKKAQP